MNLEKILADHALWIEGKGGARADLRYANLRYANLRDANLRYANLRDANLRYANLRYANLRYANLRDANLHSAELRYANLRHANLSGANLSGANMIDADLRHANLRGANLSVADLLCFGNMREIKTLQIDTWRVAYTSDTLQIGCQTHPIEKWRKWNTAAGRKWIDNMGDSALAWADKHLDLVLQIIDVSPGEGVPE